MKVTRWLLPLVSVCLLAGAARAQDAPKAQPILTCLPADTMAFVVVNDVQGTTDRVDAFMATTGLDALTIGEGLPILELIKLQAMLGDGFNPNGGCAFVISASVLSFKARRISFRALHALRCTDHRSVERDRRGHGPPDR